MDSPFSHGSSDQKQRSSEHSEAPLKRREADIPELKKHQQEIVSSDEVPHTPKEESHGEEHLFSSGSLFQTFSPFQLSAPHERIAQPSAEDVYLSPPSLQHPGTPVAKDAHASGSVSTATPPRRPGYWKYMLFSCCCILVLVTLAFVLMLPISFPSFVQQHKGTPVLSHHPTAQPHVSPVPSQKTPSPTSERSTPAPTPSVEPQKGVRNWTPIPILVGWKDAGLTSEDILAAQKTAVTFTDLEMSLDYRHVGLREAHDESLIAALPWLTEGGQQRFLRYDKRMANNTLFDQLQRERIIQYVVMPQSALKQWAPTSTSIFAWVDVEFGLWKSSLNTVTGRRQETTLPETHHMGVLLARDEQSSTGWLVSTYTLDTPGYPLVVYPV